MSTATLNQPSTAQQTKPKMKFRLRAGSYTMHSDEQKARIAELTDQLDAAVADKDVRLAGRIEKEIEAIRPIQYMSRKRAEGYCRQNGLTFDEAAYRGDILESDEDLCKSHNLRNELGVPQQTQECDLQGVHMDFRKFERLGELENRGSVMERRQNESASDWAARIQDIANQARLVAEAEASAQAAAVGVVPGLKEAVGTTKEAVPVAKASGTVSQIDKLSEKELREFAAQEEINVEKCRSRDDLLRQIKAAGQRK